MGGRQQEVLLCCDDTSLLAVRQCYRMLPPSGEAATAQGQACSAQQQQQQAAGEGWFGPHLEARLAALLSLLSSVSFQQAVVFCKYKAGAPLRISCCCCFGGMLGFGWSAQRHASVLNQAAGWSEL